MYLSELVEEVDSPVLREDDGVRSVELGAAEDEAAAGRHDRLLGAERVGGGVVLHERVGPVGVD